METANASLIKTVKKIFRSRHQCPDKNNPASEESSGSRNEPEIDSLLAEIFSCVSAIKTAYSQLQIAELPYNPEAIQASDQAIVSELSRASALKQNFLSEKRRNVLRGYEITARKLESSLQSKDDQIQFLRLQLHDSLDDLSPSLPDPRRFVATLRSAVKSIRHFVRQMIREMEYAGWDLDTAAAAIEPAVRGRSEHRIHAFESFVGLRVFSGFQCRDFGIADEGRPLQDRRRLFKEFVELGEAGSTPGLIEFIRTKYLSLVHPKMEASFFGGRGFPQASELFALFAEMAKRVWILHRLYFSYGEEGEGAEIFQVRIGCRFSEVYMESVAGQPALFPVSSPAGLTVAFTVLPGFRVGKTLIPCKVYLSRAGKADERSRFDASNYYDKSLKN